MESWPTTLPGPITENFGIDRVTSLRNVEMEAGPDRQRPITTGRLRTVSIAWMFRGGQWDVFEAFFEDALNAGADWFEARWRLNGKWRTVQVRFQKGVYKQTPQGADATKVTATLDWRG